MAPSIEDKSETLLSEDPMDVRKWLSTFHPKQLSQLDKFEIELRLGRLSTCNDKAQTSTSSGATASNSLLVGNTNRLLVTLRTVELLRNIVGSTRWRNAAQLLTLLRGLGRELHAAGGFKEPVIENIVRRIMAVVREEVLTGEEEQQKQDQQQTSLNPSAAPRKPTSDSGRLSLQSMLWALPQHHVKTPSKRSLSKSTSRGESFASEADLHANESGGGGADYAPEYYTNRPDLKHNIMEAIQEITGELEDLHKNINDQATNHIHAGEIILTYGRSKTVEYFLKAAAAKKRRFQVVICESAPYYGGHEMAESLAEYGIDTVVINDSATFAVMARVNKVLVGALAVLASGGLVTTSGCNMVAMCAKKNSVPVVCLTGMFKLCPIFPHEGQDTLNDLQNPSSIIDYTELNEKEIKANDVEFINPVHDYIKPDHISLYVTNVGSFQPSYIYRLLAEYYHTDDWESFE